MTFEEMEHIKRILSKDPSVDSDKTVLESYFKKYNEKNRDDRYEVFDKVTLLAVNRKWSRRKLLGLMSEIFFDTSCSLNLREDFRDDIEGYLDNICGMCLWNIIVKLKHDPEDKLELSNFVRSRAWVYKSYYTD